MAAYNSLEFMPFGVGCECGQAIVVKPHERCQPVKCLVCGRLHGPFGNMPSAERLPAKDAELKEMIRFADAYNPTPHFRKQWGEDYRSRVGSLWNRYVQAYRSGAVAVGPLDELLLCFADDIGLGPYLGVPEPHKLGFLRWLLDGIERELRSAAGGGSGHV